MAKILPDAGADYIEKANQAQAVISAMGAPPDPWQVCPFCKIGVEAIPGFWVVACGNCFDSKFIHRYQRKQVRPVYERRNHP